MPNQSITGSRTCAARSNRADQLSGCLARYFAITAATPAALFDRRLDFLNLCPATDLAADVRPMIASYGATCQPTGDEWRMCAPFYDHPVTAYEAPRLDEEFEEVPDADGTLVERCTYTWVPADAPVSAGG